jgi:hypothetical protein
MNTESTSTGGRSQNFEQVSYNENIIRATGTLKPHRRWEAICRERLEAIQSNKPLPIKPMTIELSLCYKKPKAEQAG